MQGQVRRWLERRVSRVLHEPPSVRAAISVIVSTTLLVVIAGGVAMRVLDHEEYPNVWVGMWWALQTVTTVGYGDVTPAHASGRIVAVFVMLQGVAFVTIVVAAITSIFVARAAQERGVAEGQAEARIEARLEDVDRRLARLEGMEQRFDRLEELLRK